MTRRDADDLLARIQQLEDARLEDVSSGPQNKRTRDSAELSESSRSSGAATSEGDDDEYHLNSESPTIDTKQRVRLMQIEKIYRPAEPKEYSGGNVSETREFIRRCEGVFITQPHIYYYQKDKYMFARTRLAGRVATNWHTHEKNLESRRHTWVVLKEWLLDQVQDPNNRSISFLLRLYNHKQRDYQRVEDYATYLENAEQEIQMEPLTETQRMGLLIAGLTPPLREKLLDQQSIPYTRAELLPLLSRLEANLRRGGPNRPTVKLPRTDGDTIAPGATTVAERTQITETRKQLLPMRERPQEPSPRPRPTWVSQANRTEPRGPGEIICFNCNERGHISRHCPRKNSRP